MKKVYISWLPTCLTFDGKQWAFKAWYLHIHTTSVDFAEASKTLSEQGFSQTSQFPNDGIVAATFAVPSTKMGRSVPGEIERAFSQDWTIIWATEDKLPTDNT